MSDAEIIAVLLEHAVEWHREQDMGASRLYCPSCRATSRRASWAAPEVCEHKLGCELKAALGAARARIGGS